VVFEFTGHASDAGQVIMGRLVGAEDFALHEQLMVKGEMDNGSVQVRASSLGCLRLRTGVVHVAGNNPHTGSGRQWHHIAPANGASCEDLQLIFGTQGTGHVCQCQRYTLGLRESFQSFPLEERALRLRE
jgi:hypothetical protein